MNQILPKPGRQRSGYVSSLRMLFFLVAFVTNAMKGLRHLARKGSSFNRPAWQGAFALTLLISAFSVTDAIASHYRYGNISWSRLNTSTRDVTITVNQAYRLNFFGAVSVGSTVSTESLNFGDGSSTNISLTVTSINVAEDYFIGTATINHTYGGSNTDFTVFYESSARVSSLQNNSNAGYRCEALVRLVANNLGSPVSTLPPVISLPVNTNATFQVPAVDPDATTLGYAMSVPSEYIGSFGTGVDAPGLSINPTTGLATFNTTGKTVGHLYNGAFTITDASGSKAIVDFILKIVNTSTPPSFNYGVTPVNNYAYNVHPGTPVSFNLSASDADVGSTVTISGVGIPPGATFSNSSTANPATTSFSWTPSVSQLGLYVITFTATDDLGVQTNTTVTINVNMGPEFKSPTPTEMPHRFVQSGTPVSDVIKAENPDPSILTHIFSGTLPSGASVTPSLPTTPAASATTTMSWTPAASNYGVNTFTFTAKDQNNQTATRSYVIEVNTLPQFTSTPVTAATACQPYVYNITGIDANIPFGDTLEFESHDPLPSWLSIVSTGNGTAQLIGTPSAADTGVYEIELVAADLYHHAFPHVEQAFDITVSPQTVLVSNGGPVCSGNNGAFTITGPAGSQVAYEINGTPGTATLTGGTATVNATAITAARTMTLVSVTNPANSCVESLSSTSTININPIPVGSASAQTICSGSTSSVTLNSTISGGTFTWTAALQSGTVTGFSSCATGCGSSIAQTLENTGTGTGVVRYTVTPISPANCPGATFTVDVTVNAKPVANAGVDKIICGTGDALQANLPVAPQTGAWSIISGTSTATAQFSSLTDANAVFTPAVNPGTYTLKWNLSNATCATSADTVVITSLGSVQGTITASSNANVCSGQTSNINISVNPVSGGTFSGTFTNGKSFTNLTPNAGIISPSYSFTNNTTTNTTESFVLSSLVFYPNTSTQPTPASCAATVQAMGGQTLVTVQPVADLNAVVTGADSLCSGGSVTIAVTNPNVVGGTYNRTTMYNGVSHSAAASTSGQSYNTNGTFTETLTNNTNAPLTVVYTFTPVSPGSQGCVGTPSVVSVKVLPTPVMVAAADQQLCNGAATTAVNFSASVSGAGFSWTNDNTSIGLAASGNGNINVFNAVNNGTTNAVAHIRVVPAASGCVGAADTFMITVKPTPNVVASADQAACNGANTTAVSFNGAVSNTAFSWTNNDATIGLAASGIGNIGAFAAINNGTTDKVARIRVVPSANGCNGAADTFLITVKPTPNVADPADQLVCNGAPVAAVNFNGTVSNTVFEWTNDNSGIGLASSGTGNIGTFNAINTGSTNTVAHIRIVPKANGCDGTADTFMITVKPTPTVAGTVDQAVCNDATTAAVTFNGAVSNTVFNWSNDNPAIGLAAGGSGTIAAFNAINTTNADVVAHIRVLPEANGCFGMPDTFTIRVKPTPDVLALADQSVCNGAATTAMNFSGAVNGTTFSWTNDNANVGLAANGLGNIASFNAINNGTTNAVAHIRVVPMADGCSGKADTIVLTVKPTPNVAATTDLVACNGTQVPAVNFNGAVNGTVFQWTNDNPSIGLAAGGTGNILAFNGINTGSVAAVAHIYVSPEANGCTGAKDTFTVTVNPSPAFTFSVNGSAMANNETDTICQATSTTFAISGATPGFGFNMTFNNAPYATGVVNANGGFTHTFISGGTPSNTTAGTYELTLTNNVTGCTASKTYHIYVNPKPADTFTVNGAALAAGQTATHCEGEALQLAVTGENGHTYVISKGNTTIASGNVNGPAYTIQSAALSDAGTYTVALTNTATGCMASRTYQLVVNPLPVYAMHVNNSVLADNATTTHCKGQQITLELTGDTATSYVLEHNGSPIASGNVNDPAFNFTAGVSDAGTYTLTVTSPAGCVRTSSYTMVINEAPEFTLVPANATANTATGTCTAVVSYGSATASGVPAATMSYAFSGATTGSGSGTGSGSTFNKGVTQVTLTAANICGSKDSTFTVTVNDMEVPAFTSCPANINTFSATNDCGNNVINVNPAYTDNCTLGSAPLAWTLTGATLGSGTGNIGTHHFNVGVTQVTYTVTDASGNHNTCSYNVTVTDNVFPTISCVQNIVRNNDMGICGATVSYSAPTGNDNCSGYTVAQTAGLPSGSIFPLGVTTNTFTVTDAAGNTASCSFTVTVNDNQAPILTPPAAQILNVGAGNNCQVLMPDYRNMFTVNENCGGTVILEQLAPNQPGSLVIGYGGTRTIKVKATDIAGNSRIDSFMLNLVDQTAPVAVCKNITVNLNASGAASITPSMIDNNSHDNCSAVTLSASKLTFDCSNVGPNSVVLTATDVSGNASTCTATVTIKDVTAPVVNCWSDTTMEKGTLCTTQLPDLTHRVTSSDACGVATVTQSPVQGTIIGASTQSIPVVLTVTDVNGNQSQCSFQINFTDQTKPAILNFPADIVVNNGQDSCGKKVNWTVPTASDNCNVLGAATLTSNIQPGTIFPVGVTTVTYTATDIAGNDSVRSFSVTVVDAQAPVIAGCPATVSVNTDNNATICGAVATWTEPTATDNCTPAGSLVWTKSHTPGTVFPVGTTTVTYTATDAKGNISTACSFNVVVADHTAPVVTGCPANITVQTGAGATSCDAVAIWTEPTATDNCTASNGLTWTKSHTPGSVFPVGTTAVTYTAHDLAGNVSATCTFNVTVEDNTVPVLAGCPGTVLVNTGSTATNCSAVATWTEPTASDNCTASGSLVWTKSHTPGSVFPVGLTQVTYTATDASGNVSATCTFNVVVSDNTAPVIAGCPANLTVPTGANATGCNAVVTWTEPTVTDNCTTGSGLVWTKSHTPGSVFPVGTTAVTYTATDASGNASTCTFNVTVTDNTAPVFAVCPAPMTSVATNVAGCAAVVTTVDPAVTDNCNMSSLTWTLSGATTGASAATGINNLGTHQFELGTTTVTYTATDAAGNTQVCAYTIEVVNTLAGYISGTSTVAQNVNTTSNITFAASGGKAPFTFTYKVNNGATQTISTTGSNTVTTVPQSNAVLGTFEYTLLSVTDANGCTGALPVDNKDTITVVASVPVANLAPTINVPVPSFTSTNTTRPYTINVFNVGNVPSTGNIVLYVLKPTGTGSSMTFNSANWTVTEAPTYYMLESSMVINGNFGFTSIPGTIQLDPSVANGTYSVQVIVGPGSGSDNTPANNASSAILNKTN